MQMSLFAFSLQKYEIDQGLPPVLLIRRSRSDASLFWRAAGVGDVGLATVARLTALSELHLDGRSFTDLGLRTIAPLTRLRHLDLYGARITDAGCVHLRCALAASCSKCISVLMSLLDMDFLGLPHPWDWAAMSSHTLSL